MICKVQEKGKQMTFKADNLDYCGAEITFYAYIEYKETEAERKVFHHNRFRWFDKKMLEEQIKRTIENPWRINQADSSLCGMAAIFYLFAKEKPEQYKQYVLDLFRTGQAKCNEYTAEPDIEITDRTIKKETIEGEDVFTAKDSGKLRLVDFITLAGTRNNESSWYKGGDEQVAAISWPNILTSLLEQLMGYKEVVSEGCYMPIKPLMDVTLGVENTIDDINKQLANGYRLILLIDSDLIDDKSDFESVDYHWVTLETPINLDKTGKEPMVNFQNLFLGD